MRPDRQADRQTDLEGADDLRPMRSAGSSVLGGRCTAYRTYSVGHRLIALHVALRMRSYDLGSLELSDACPIPRT